MAEALGPRAPAGRALDLACGEGRNAIWLAKRGWSVTAIDFSAVALARARRLAGTDGVAVDWVCADVTAFEVPPGAFALVLVSYLHLPAPARRVVLRRAVAALAPGGRLFLIGHALRNLSEGFGGPRDASLLWSPQAIAAEVREAGLRVERCQEVERPVEDEAGARTAIDLLLEAQRPAGPPSREGRP